MTTSPPFDGLIENISAVYLWKYAENADLIEDPEDLLKYIDKCCERSLGPEDNTKFEYRNHAIKINGGVGVQLRGTPMPINKSDQVRNLLRRSPGALRPMREFLDSMSQHSPALYVGESKRLRQRILEHLESNNVESSGTLFGMVVDGSDELSWKDLDLYYYELGGTPLDDIRKAVEYTATMMSVGAYTKRPG